MLSLTHGNNTRKATTMKTSDLFPTRYVKLLNAANVWKANFLGTRIEATAASKEDAIAGVINQIRRIDQYGDTRVYRFAKDGTLFHMYFAYGCFCYDIVHPANGEKMQTSSSCHVSAPTYQEAYEQMMRHIEQYND